MNRKNWVYLFIVLTVYGYCQLVAIKTEWFHLDMVYFGFFFLLLLVGLVGSILMPRTFFHALLLSGIWVLFYLINAMKHGFNANVFTFVIKSAVIMGAVFAILNGAIVQFKRRSAEKREIESEKDIDVE